ncbi:GIY-YIG nuclease family protein [Paraburkholderia guartelaensis]|uniref:GIY-YIG nuclease family protein n=1 Tax=Paraburkholderia TaxID=1822464 RepID=UPI0038BB7060
MTTIRGWVYVITNKAMPDLVKIGYSIKDPALRAKELASTGVPEPYKVQYDILVLQPREVEQRVHVALAELKAGKEWFKCTVSHAIGTIVRIAGSDALLEHREELLLCRTAVGEVETDVLKSNGVRITRTMAVNGACQRCGTSFSVTLTRGESSARCPECFSSVVLGANWY